MSTTSILVPLDGSQFAEASLPAAIALSEHLNTMLHLVTVYFDEPVMAEWDIPTSQLKTFHTEYITATAERVRAVSEVDITTTVLGGPVGKTLEDVIARTEPRLVVLSTHGRGPVSRAWLGSIADRLLRHIEEPILMVRPEDEGPADLTFRPDFRRILIALDGSERAEAAVRVAQEVGRGFNARYTLFRAVPPTYAASPYLPHTVAETREAMERGQGDAENYLSGIASTFAEAGLVAETEVSVGTQPASGLIHHASGGGADLIAIATHGRGGIPRLVLGSVADKVARGSPVPVLVVRPAKD